MGFLIMCLCISCTANGATENFMESLPPTETVPVTEEPSEAPSPSETVLPTEEPDTEGPVISGVQPLTAVAGGTISYRDGVTAVDDRDGPVPFQVDSSRVDLNVPGEYEVIYSAEDSSGNRTEVTTAVVVLEPEPDPEPTATQKPKTITLDDVNAQADKILAKITNDGMSQAQKARAIYDYVRTHIVYVGYSDKSSWIIGAYNGFKYGWGDCYNYFACSKALLTRAGIPNVDVKRMGGSTRHYWNLVDVGTGYYHFDATFHSNDYAITSFMLTDAETEEYTLWRGNNYYTYNHSSISVTVATTPFSGTAWHWPGWTPPAEPEPEVPVEPVPEVTPEIPDEPAPEVTPEVPDEPAPETTPEVPDEPAPEVTPEVPDEPTPETTPEVPDEPAPEETPAEPQPAPDPEPEEQEV